MTPEGKIKAAINAVLKRYGDAVYYFMPVQTGYGRATLDYLGWVRGFAFAIEAKRPGGRPTARQKGTIEVMERAGARVFVIDNAAGVGALDDWLRSIVGEG